MSADERGTRRDAGPHGSHGPSAPAAPVTPDGPRPGLVNRVAGVALAAAALVLLVAASQLPVPVHPSDDAMLRVAWSARPERVESCRTLGDEELAELPQHMRQRVVCEGTTARYRLDVSRDGQLLSTAVIRGGGLRHDRQLYAFQELRIPHGRSTLAVTLTRLDSAAATPPAGAQEAGATAAPASGGQATLPPSYETGFRTTPGVPGSGGRADDMGDRDQRQADEHRRRVADEVPASLSLAETVTLAPREVVLLTYDADARRFRLQRRDQNQ